MSSNPEIVSAIYNLDLSTLQTRGLVGLLRLDGTPATADEINALKQATADDLEAACNMHLLAVEREEYRMDKMQRIRSLYDKYSKGNNENLAALEARMTPEDRAKCRGYWDDIGGVAGATL